MEQRANSGNGFILLGAQNATDSFLPGQFYTYYDNKWSFLDNNPLLNRRATLALPSFENPQLRIQLRDNNIAKLLSGYSVEFLPALGSHAWDIVDFVQTNSGFKVIKKLSCEEGREPTCQ